MRCKILVIEDDALLLKIVTDRLVTEDFDVLQAKDGEEGLSMALSQKPDLILLDIIMPKMDGLTMLAKLRENEWGKNARIIITSNLSDEDKLKDAMNKGVYDYLIKSEWSLDDLIHKVRDKVGNF